MFSYVYIHTQRNWIQPTVVSDTSSVFTQKRKFKIKAKMSNRKHNSMLLVELLENAPQVAAPPKKRKKKDEKVEKKKKKKKVEKEVMKECRVDVDSKKEEKKRKMKKKKKVQRRRRAKHIALSVGWHCEMRDMCVWGVYVTQGYETLESISEYEGSASVSDLINNNQHTYPGIQKTTTLTPGSSIFIRMFSSSKGLTPLSSGHRSSRIGEQYQADIPSLESLRDSDERRRFIDTDSAKMDTLLRSNESETTKKKSSRRELFAFYNALQRHGKEFKKIRDELKWKSVAYCVDFYYRVFKVSELYRQWKTEWQRKKAIATTEKLQKAKKSRRLQIPSEFIKPLLASYGNKTTTKSSKVKKKRKNKN